MPAWLLPALKAVLPHVSTVISAAAPVFTRRSADAAANQAALLQQQITELQSAASDNDAHIKELAAQIRSTVEALEKGALLAEQRYRRQLAVGIAASALSLVSLGIALFVLVAR